MKNREEFKDYYEILGLSFGSTIEKVKSAFRKLAKKYHPDVNDGQESKDFKLILEAYKVLSDNKSKELYDKKYLEKKKCDLSVEVKKSNSQISTNIVDPSRVEYKMSLLNLSRAGFDLSKKFTREDFLEELGEDLVVYLTDKEIEEGAFLVIKLPARAVCNVCYGANRNCYRCDGTGYITTLEELKIPIPPNTRHSETIYVDLRKGHKRRGGPMFVLRELKVRVKWLSISDID
ncbi:MAG: DnaJ domain-containing protein [Brevinematia bacterium]